MQKEYISRNWVYSVHKIVSRSAGIFWYAGVSEKNIFSFYSVKVKSN